jgi:hypothetical protein
MFVPGIITATNMTAYLAKTQMNPRIPHSQTFFTSLRLRGYIPYHLKMAATSCDLMG